MVKGNPCHPINSILKEVTLSRDAVMGCNKRISKQASTAMKSILFKETLEHGIHFPFEKNTNICLIIIFILNNLYKQSQVLHKDR